jgi:Aldo/keto reductase family
MPIPSLLFRTEPLKEDTLSAPRRGSKPARSNPAAYRWHGRAEFFALPNPLNSSNSCLLLRLGGEQKLMDISRRGFIKGASSALAFGLGSGSLLPLAGAAEETSKLVGIQVEERRRGEMIFRRLGKIDEWVSVIGLGGYHIGKQADENESIQLIRGAIDKGVSFMDNCWDYNRGESEVRMGKALRDGYREKVFLMTKIDGRTKVAAGQQIDDSLRRLQTDHIDRL